MLGCCTYRQQLIPPTKPHVGRRLRTSYLGGPKADARSKKYPNKGLKGCFQGSLQGCLIRAPALTPAGSPEQDQRGCERDLPDQLQGCGKGPIRLMDKPKPLPGSTGLGCGRVKGSSNSLSLKLLYSVAGLVSRCFGCAGENFDQAAEPVVSFWRSHHPGIGRADCFC